MTGVRPPSPDAPLEPDPMLGRVLSDRYRIEALVARGGMARVYRARDTRLERDVALKVLAPPYSDDPAFTERFLAEARAAASISHPSLVHVYDSGSDGAAHFIAMELLDRHRTVRDVLGERRRLPVAEVIRIGTELLAGLRAVHERGLVHCDVKAANVMLGPGPAKLIDFGIARPPNEATEGETSIGTLQSMSPEQLHGEPLTPASDLFSLGVVLYQAATGRMPYPGRNPQEVSAAHRAERVVPPSAHVPELPPRLDGVILQSLRRDPHARFHSATAMSNALELARDLASHGRGDDETRVVRTAPPSDAVPPPRERAGGYVPPPLPPERSRPSDQPSRYEPRRPSAPARQRPAPVARPRRRRSIPWGALGTLAILAAAGLVVVLVVLPLLDLGRSGSDGTGTPPSSAPVASATPAVSTMIAPNVIPDVVGMPTDEAIAIAQQAGLNWRVECDEDPARPEGIIDQQPPAGTPVAPGSRFTMFSARFADCQ